MKVHIILLIEKDRKYLVREVGYVTGVFKNAQWEHTYTKRYETIDMAKMYARLIREKIMRKKNAEYEVYIIRNYEKNLN